MTDTMHPETPAALHQASHAFVPKRLTIAREAAGLTQKALASRIDTTPSAVSQFESGVAKPRPDTVARLALTLGVPPGFFAEPIPCQLLSPDICHFRSRRTATKEEQRRVLARANLLILLAEYLRELVQFPNETIESLRTVVTNEQEIEDLVEQLRETWGLGLGPIGDMITLVESKGVFVLQVMGHSANLDAFSAWSDDRPFIIVTSDKGSASRRRFDVAHELGHLLLHIADSGANRHKEAQADRFASAFLLPARSFAKECPRRLSWPHFRALKKRWKVSLAALVRRAFELGLISEATYRRAFVQLNHSGWRKLEPEEPALENGSLIVRAIDLLVAQGRSIERIAAGACLRAANVERLLEAFYSQRTLSLSM